ncbi:Uncharacterized protein HZ326_1502 [Fusarium oxysporum f. sp. albedinis]|nr:Uncharacterized protein HZ326_1502 [Fusarium oxysporum f. sp. albedinis]
MQHQDLEACRKFLLILSVLFFQVLSSPDPSRVTIPKPQIKTQAVGILARRIDCATREILLLLLQLRGEVIGVHCRLGLSHGRGGHGSSRFSRGQRLERRLSNLQHFSNKHFRTFPWSFDHHGPVVSTGIHRHG